MRYGICTGLENLELLENLGYDYIEPNITNTLGLEPEVLEEYREKLKHSKLKCETFNVLFPQSIELIGGKSSDEEIKEHLHKAMALIKSLGGEIVVFGSGKCRNCPEHISYTEGYKRLIEVYRMTGDIAAEYGLTVVIEPLNRLETNMINSMSEGAALEAVVDHPNVKLLADFYHVIMDHDNIADIEVIENFSHIHIAAGHGRTYPLPEDGEEYAAFIKALKAVGYDARISIEGKTENIEEDGAKALELLKNLEKMC